MTQARGLFFMLFATGTAWGLSTPLAKIVVEGGYRDFGAIFWQFAFSAVLLCGWLAWNGRGLPLRADALARYAFIGLVGMLLPNLSFFLAIKELPAGLMAVFIAFTPLFALPLALLFGLERPERARLLGLLCGLVGALMIVLPDASLPDGTGSIFILLALATALLYAMEAVGIGRLGTAGLDSVQILTGGTLLALVPALPLAVLSGSWIVPAFPPQQADIALVSTAAINAASYSGYLWIVDRGGALFAAQVSYLVTGTGVLWSMLILGESYSLWIWLALGAVFVGIFLVQPRTAVPPPGSMLALTEGDANITREPGQDQE